MDASLSISKLLSAINLCVIFSILVCPLSSSAHIDFSSKCPHIVFTGPNNSKNNESLRVVVPWRLSFQQFVSVNPDSCFLDGFSVQVFRHAVSRMSDPPRFHIFVVGNGTVSPSYNDMITMVATGEADVVVADVTITKERMEKVAFTMPYLASTMVMVTPYRYNSEGALWDFLRPFSMPLWITLLSCFIATGVVLYLLENKNPDFSITASSYTKKHFDINGNFEPTHATYTPNHEEFTPSQEPTNCVPSHNPMQSLYSDPSSLQRPGPPIYEASHKCRIMNAYWFTSLCIFAAQQESVRTHLGRFVTVMWLFLMLISNSSYTASLASLLSAHKKYPTIDGLKALKQDSNISIGCQGGSFMLGYIEKLGIQPQRLRMLNREKDYAQALKKGNVNPNAVGAVLGELPYVQIFLQSQCDVTMISDDESLPSFGGFGFAFRKNSSQIEEVSKMIIAMEEDGELHHLKQVSKIDVDKKSVRCSSSNEPSTLMLRSFGGLFSILAGVYASCVLMRFLATKVVLQKK